MSKIPPPSTSATAEDAARPIPDPARPPSSLDRVRSWLGLERNIRVMLGAMLLLGMGEELWTRFIPKYLELLGATAWGIAAYGTLKDLLDAIYQEPMDRLSVAFLRQGRLLVCPIQHCFPVQFPHPFLDGTSTADVCSMP